MRYCKEVWKYELKLIFSHRLGSGRERLNIDACHKLDFWKCLSFKLIWIPSDFLHVLLTNRRFANYSRKDQCYVNLSRRSHLKTFWFLFKSTTMKIKNQVQLFMDHFACQFHLSESYERDERLSHPWICPVVSNTSLTLLCQRRI